MDIFTSIQPFGFAMDVLCLTLRTTTVNKLAVIDLQRIMTPSLVSLDMFALVIPYLLAVLFVKIMTA